MNMQARPPLMPMSGEQRSALRRALVQSPHWKGYRDMHDLSMDKITTQELWDAAYAVGLDAVAIISPEGMAMNAQEEHHKPRPFDAESVGELRARFLAQARTLDGHHHPMFARLLKMAVSRRVDGFVPNIWLSGPAGSGKTHAAKMVAKALGLAWHYNGALSMPHELLGFRDARGNYHRTPFREAYEHGGVYLFDEVDASDNSALLALNAALANGTATFPDGQVQRHANCIIIATANTWGLGATADYVGRSKIDAAFLSRFPGRLPWDYDSALEVAISGNAAFARRVIKARERARTHGIKVIIDPRASIAGSAYIANGFSSDEAADMTYLANLTPEHRKLVEGH